MLTEKRPSPVPRIVNIRHHPHAASSTGLIVVLSFAPKATSELCRLLSAIVVHMVERGKVVRAAFSVQIVVEKLLKNETSEE